MRILAAALFLLSACASGPRPDLSQAELAALAAGIETDCGLQPRSLLRVEGNRHLMISIEQAEPSGARPPDYKAFACVVRALDTAALEARGVTLVIVGSSTDGAATAVPD